MSAGEQVVTALCRFGNHDPCPGRCHTNGYEWACVCRCHQSDEEVEIVVSHAPRNLAVETGRLIGLLAGVLPAGYLSSRGERT